MKELTEEQIREIAHWIRKNEDDVTDLTEQFKVEFGKRPACSAHDVVHIILHCSDPERGEFFSNLRMQKMLFLAQALYLARYKKPLFKEDILVWQYGPVVNDVFYEYSWYHKNRIPLPIHKLAIEEYKETLDKLSDHIVEFIGKIYDNFYKYSTLGMQNIIDEDETYKSTPLNEIIPHDGLLRSFQPMSRHVLGN